MQMNISFLILIHILAAFMVTLVIGFFGLPFLRKVKAGQYIRVEGPKSHAVKTGTPTMGGWFFIIAILIVTVLSNYFLDSTPVSSWFYVTTLFFYAAIGFIDDYLKVVLKQNEGLTSKQKFLLQIGMVLVLFVVFNSHFSDTSVQLFKWIIKLPLVLYIVFQVVWFVGFSNATNVTDGLDGLLATTAAIAFTALAIIALMGGNNGTALFCFIVVGSLLGFLVFNHFPAKVFMGDTGSLALGALLAAVALELDIEFLLLLIGIVFVIETASVMLQVAYFKYTKKKTGEGKRIFLMSPFHHHLELKGNKEQSIVLKLSLIGLAGAVASIGIFYYFW